MPITEGMRVRSPATAPEVDGLLTNGANGFLQNFTGQRVGLWVNQVESSFELAGQTAQGPVQRDFYAHNLTQPSITIGGQTPNNYEYNRLADFIRHSQLDALGLGPAPAYVLKLFVSAGRAAIPKRPTMRGPHGEINADGFVDTAAKGGLRFVTAHDYTFQFVVTNVHSLLGLEDRVMTPYLTLDTIGARLKQGRAENVAKVAKPIAQDDPSPAPTPPQVDPTDPLGVLGSNLGVMP